MPLTRNLALLLGVLCGAVPVLSFVPSALPAPVPSARLSGVLRGSVPAGRLVRRRFAPAAALEVVDASYNLALGSLALGGLFGVPGSPLKSKVAAFAAGIPLALFGLFLAFQTTTLRFTFDDTSFSLVKADLSSTGKNVVVGGENSWAYDSFVNYDFFPSESFPILVYFKETQTASDKWNVGPGEKANSPEAIAKGAKPGQVHFFPAIANVQQLKAAFEAHDCSKL